jgi:hypothetical protein
VSSYSWPADPSVVVPARKVAIEVIWRGGHPSSYGLLGAELFPTNSGFLNAEISVFSGQFAPFPESLAAGLDNAGIGLPNEYVSGVVRGLDAGVRFRNRVAAGLLVVRHAAHGLVGSSPLIFQWLGTAIPLLLHQQVMPRNEEIRSILIETGHSCGRFALRPEPGSGREPFIYRPNLKYDVRLD